MSPLACSQALGPLVCEPDVSVHESKVDRLIRATLRFNSSPEKFHVPHFAKDSFSPTLYAGLLCIHPYCSRNALELVMSNLIASDGGPYSSLTAYNMGTSSSSVLILCFQSCWTRSVADAVH